MSFRSNTPKVTKITFGEIKFLFGVIIITSGEAQVKSFSPLIYGISFAVFLSFSQIFTIANVSRQQFCSKAVVVSSANFSSPDKAAIKQIISEIIEKLRT